MTNPFSLSFGREPENLISIDMQLEEIKDSFMSSKPSTHVFMITGVRGSGKTVLMTRASHIIENDKDWIVVDLNSERDLLASFYAELERGFSLKKILEDTKLDLSLFGVGISLEKKNQKGDAVILLDEVLNQLTKKGKKILVTIDEVVPNKSVREFMSQFQIFMRKGYNVFLLMTGLYENIYNLQNKKTLTFLYRAPKITMEGLNKKEIAREYKSVFNLEDKEAQVMAETTNGYAYAYQVMGYLCFKHHSHYLDILPLFDQYMEEYVYEKIWQGLSNIDRRIIEVICEGKRDVKEIRSALAMDSNNFNVYRTRLLRKGVVRVSQYGYLCLALPRFDVFVKEMNR